MLRKVAAVSLAVSFVAMATSGLMMYVVEKPSFTIQMHPVYKVFGILVAALVLLYGVAVQKEIPAELAQQMDDAAAQVDGED